MGNKKKAKVNDRGLELFRFPTPKSDRQVDYINSIRQNSITICVGCAGTGKSHLAIGAACQALWEGQIDQIIMTRPVVESSGGKGLGYLPGTVDEKLNPYMMPLVEEMRKFYPVSQIHALKQQEAIRAIPLEFMRGINFHNAIVIGDEFQNATLSQIKMFLTRMGSRTKMIMNGDMRQTDLDDRHIQGLPICIDKLHDVEGVGIIQLGSEDIVRNKLISKIMDRFEDI